MNYPEPFRSSNCVQATPDSVLREHKAEVHAHHEAMEKIIETQNETALRLAVCLDRNTAALSECSFELRRLQMA